jgi:hypothetical protein
MKPSEGKLLTAIHRIAGELPADQRDALIAALMSVPHGDWPETRKRVMEALSVQPYQVRAANLHPEADMSHLFKL